MAPLQHSLVYMTLSPTASCRRHPGRVRITKTGSDENAPAGSHLPDLSPRFGRERSYSSAMVAAAKNEFAFCSFTSRLASRRCSSICRNW